MTNTTTLTIGQNQYATKQVGEHSFAEIPVKVFCELPPAPVQRNSHLRVNKMRSIFDLAYLAGQSSTLTEVALGVVVSDFDDIDHKTGRVIASYKQGEVSIIDGATRMHYWKTYPKQAESLKKNLTAKLHFLSSMNDVRFAYYPYNSKASTEKTNELLQGLARRYNWQPRQPMFINGNYKTAIDWATSRPDDDRAFEPEVGFNFNFEELKILDSIPKGSGPTISKPALPKIKSQPIVAAILIALKMYPNNVRLFDFIERLINITTADLHQAMANKQITPVEIIALEWQGWSAQRGSNTTSTWLNDTAGSTNYASKEPQLDFLLYWIIEHIQNPSCKHDFNKGVRPSSWEGTWKEIFTDDDAE